MILSFRLCKYKNNILYKIIILIFSDVMVEDSIVLDN
nr:MAG TPA: hypothetical protein [Caudoviricetes sp.]